MTALPLVAIYTRLHTLVQRSASIPDIFAYLRSCFLLFNILDPKLPTRSLCFLKVYNIRLVEPLPV